MVRVRCSSSARTIQINIPKSCKPNIQFDFRPVLEKSTNDPKSRKAKIDFKLRAVLEQSTDDPPSLKTYIIKEALEF